MVARTFSWLATSGGAWSLAANWNDITDGIDPSLIAPGPQDTAIVGGPTGSTIETITGPGAAAAARFTGNNAIAGSLALGSVSIGAGLDGGVFDVGGGGTLNAGTLTAASGSVLSAGSASLLSVSGALTLGGGQAGLGAAAANLEATGGGAIQAGTLILDASTAFVFVDPQSHIEIGTAGGAAAGALTIDAGATLGGQGDANAYGAVVNDGAIAAIGGELMLGTLTGTGTLNIGAGADLMLNGRTGAGQTVQFSGLQGTLAIATEFDAPQGIITGFAPGDAIDEIGSPISAAIWQQTSQSGGVLTLWYGSQIADTLTLAGNYASDVFLTAGDGALGTFIAVAPNASGGGQASQGTASPDQYVWVTQGSGNWNSAANWRDVTTGRQPAAIAPGVNDLVTINGGQGGSFTVIAGPANATSLALAGNVALGGTYSTGTLTIGQASGITGVLDLLPSAHVTATNATLADGELTISGSAVLAVSGTLALGGSPIGIGMPITALAASAGGTITAGTLTLGGGSGDTMTTDPTSVIEVGTAGGAAAGAVTIDPGATLSGNGAVNPFGTIIDNGTIVASGGGALWLGSVSGSGVLAIGSASALVLQASTAVPIGFADATGTLALANEYVSLAGTISGFAVGDTIDILGDQITGVATAKTGSGLTVYLYYGNTLVNRLSLAGNFSNDKFVLAPDGSGGTDLVTVNYGGGGGGGGQGSTDLLTWQQPGSGSWNQARNWYDVTTSSNATSAPGSQNQVLIVGPAGGSYQLISGPGVCASLACYGNTDFGGAFTCGTLTVGGTLNGNYQAGALAFTASSSMTATIAASIDGGTISIFTANTVFDVAGTLTLGDASGAVPPSLLDVSNGVSVTLGGLALAGGGTITTDLSAAVEIGTLGGAVAGAITIDSGNDVAGSGALNPGGAVIDNGTLTAQGGTLLVGAVSGTGALAIGTEATLALSAGETVPIDFTGGGATLLLQGSAEAPAGIVAGFIAGDAIITGSSQVSSVTYAPGTGNVGTLTLYYGTQIAGTLLLAGDFSGEAFTVAPDGAGSEISVQSSGGASSGTATPDDYVWTGNAGTLWNNAANWIDETAGQNPAAIAPGSHDIVAISGGTGSFTTIIGPADAASLTLLGHIDLGGSYSIGALAVGSATQTGLLAIGQGTAINTAAATITGGVTAFGAGLTDSGTLTLQSGVLAASGNADVDVVAAVLGGTADAITVDATAIVEIGGQGIAGAGAVTVDQGARLAGAGAVNPLGAIVDQGTITASAGTLSLGSLSGSGTLAIGVGATMALEAAAAASLTIDFAGPGTLAVQAALPAAWIADFGAGDAILLPIAGITEADFFPVAPGTGVLTLYAGSQQVGDLTLLGVGQGQSFSVTGADGGTVLTTQTTSWGGGGSGVRNSTVAGSGGVVNITSQPFYTDLPLLEQTLLLDVTPSQSGEAYVYTSDIGGSSANWAPYQGGYTNIAVVTDPAISSKLVLPSGYEAMVAQGTAPVTMTDGGAEGGAILIGNSGYDTIVGFGAGDTLIGGVGGSTTFFLNGSAVVYGGGNDTIITDVNTNGSSSGSAITTSTQGRSVVFLQTGDNSVTAAGNDTIICATANAGGANTVSALGADTVFGPTTGLLTHYDGSGRDIVVGIGGTIRMIGGNGNGSVLWCGGADFAEYFGGAGTAAIVGGSGMLSVQGGTAPVTVFAGTGNTIITGAAGGSVFVVGSGNATVSAASGNVAWAAGAGNESLLASGGNVILWAAGSSGNDVLHAGNGPCTMHGGLGNDTLLGGAGNATMAGGGGADLFSFTNGLCGGSNVITDYNPGADTIALHGYAAYSSSLVNGNEVIRLSDGTSIQLNGIHSLGGVTITLT